MDKVIVLNELRERPARKRTQGQVQDIPAETGEGGEEGCIWTIGGNILRAVGEDEPHAGGALSNPFEPGQAGRIRPLEIVGDDHGLFRRGVLDEPGCTFEGESPVALGIGRRATGAQKLGHVGNDVAKGVSRPVGNGSDGVEIEGQQLPQEGTGERPGLFALGLERPDRDYRVGAP